MALANGTLANHYGYLGHAGMGFREERQRLRPAASTERCSSIRRRPRPEARKLQCALLGGKACIKRPTRRNGKSYAPMSYAPTAQKQARGPAREAHKHADPRLDSFDPSRYAPDHPSPEAYYGLPRTITFCRHCVISDQRPNSAIEYQHTRDSKKATIFIADGEHDACRNAERKAAVIDWDRRRAELVALCDKYRSRTGSYDCMVPGSGRRTASTRRGWPYEFGMNPVTVTWAPHVYTDWGWRNFNRWIHADFDELPDDPERPREAPHDPARGREPLPSLPALHHRTEGVCAEDGGDDEHPAHLLWRERGRMRQPDRGQ